MECRTLTLKDANLWSELVSGTEQSDAHFLPAYLEPFEDHLNAECRMLFAGDEDEYLLYPYFSRKVGEDPLHCASCPGGTIDAMSPWYYGGALSKGDPNDDLRDSFVESLSQTLLSEGCVTLFSRSNPFRDNHHIISGRLPEKDLATVVYLDTTKDLDRIWREYSSPVRRAIRIDERNRYEIFVDSSKKYIEEFARIYGIEMGRKGARTFHRFGLEFFDSEIEGLKGKAFITNKIADGIWAAGGLTIVHNGVAYLSFATRNPELSSDNSLHGVFNEIIKTVKGMGASVLDLGGGPEGSSLLRFKKDFSNTTRSLKGHAAILDRAAYSDLCAKAGIDHMDFERSTFFPEYRDPHS